MGFEQATIRIEKEREFGDLKSALEQTFVGGSGREVPESA